MKTKADNRLTLKRAGEWAMNNTNILLMFLLIIIGAVTSQSFFSGSNLANVLRQITSACREDSSNRCTFLLADY